MTAEQEFQKREVDAVFAVNSGDKTSSASTAISDSGPGTSVPVDENEGDSEALSSAPSTPKLPPISARKKLKRKQSTSPSVQDLSPSLGQDVQNPYISKHTVHLRHKIIDGAALTLDDYFRPTADQPSTGTKFVDDVMIGIVRCIFY